MMAVLAALVGHEVAIVDGPADARLRPPGVDVPTPAAGPRARARRRAGRPRGHVGRAARTAAVRRAACTSRPGSSGSPTARRSRPARRPRAVRLTARRPTARRAFRYPRSDARRSRHPTPVRRPIPPPRPALGSALSRVARGRRPDLPVGRPRGGQDPPRQGLRRGSRRHRHDHLAELRAHGRVRGPPAAVPHRPRTGWPMRPMRWRAA